MSYVKTIYLAVLICLCICIASCGKAKHKTTSPIDADWEISISNTYNADWLKSTSFEIGIWWLGHSAISSADVAEVFMDGSPYAIDSPVTEAMAYKGSAVLNFGQTYDIKFKFNGAEVINTSLQMPYQCDVSFPEYYQPSQRKTLYWAMDHDNQAQYILVSSSCPDDNRKSKKYFTIPNAVRYFTIPENSVETYEPLTYSEITMIQSNEKYLNRVYLSASQYTYKSY